MLKNMFWPRALLNDRLESSLRRLEASFYTLKLFSYDMGCSTYFSILDFSEFKLVSGTFFSSIFPDPPIHIFCRLDGGCGLLMVRLKSSLREWSSLGLCERSTTGFSLFITFYAPPFCAVVLFLVKNELSTFFEASHELFYILDCIS